MFGILKSLSSTRPFCAPITRGVEDSIVSLPPSISLAAVTFAPSISRLIQLFIKLELFKPAIIPGTIPPL